MMSREKHQPSVGIVIVHSKGSKMLNECLESLFETDYRNFTVVLLDNNSRDGMCEYAARRYEGRIDLIRGNVSLGFGAANNYALRQTVKLKTSYIVLLNDDVIVDSNWLSELVCEAEKDPSIGACQPKLKSLREPGFFEYNGACGGMMDIYGVPLTRGRIFDLIEEDRGQYDKSVEIFWASGASLFLRSNVIDEVGLLDETFFMQMEEIDYCWRMRLSGYKVMSVPRSVIQHLGGGTPVPEKFYLKSRNNLMTIVKNYSGWNLLRFLPLRIVQDHLSLLYYMVGKQTARAMAILRAYFWLLKNPRPTIASRYGVQRRRRVDDTEIIKMMVKKSVAVQHYLLKRKYFSQLGGLPRDVEYYLTTCASASS